MDCDAWTGQLRRAGDVHGSGDCRAFGDPVVVDVGHWGINVSDGDLVDEEVSATDVL